MAVNNIQFTKIEIQIAKYIFKHYRDRLNARQIAKLLVINHAHANKLCSILADKALLIKERIGNSLYYSFNYDCSLATKFMDYLLSLEVKEFPAWLVVLLHTLDKFKPYAKLGLVFGSSLRNKDFNDVDILLVYDPRESSNIKKIRDEIRKSGLVEKPIRYMEISEKDAVSNRDDKIFYSIMSDNLVFHNPEKYVEVIKRCRKLTII